MGKIREKPKDIHYPYPKAIGRGYSIGKIIGRAKEIEHFPKFGDYMRILDLVEFQPDDHQKRHKELRFCQFYRKPKGTDNDWIFGQGAGHMSVETFYKLINKARTKPDYGTFEGVFDKLISKRDRRQKKLEIVLFISALRQDGRKRGLGEMPPSELTKFGSDIFKQTPPLTVSSAK